jgi:hypothetical protein
MPLKGEDSMPDEEPKPTIKDRWGERVIILVLFLTGLALYFGSQKTSGSWQQVLSSIGLSFLGTAFATGIVLALVGSDVGGLRKEIDKLRSIIYVNLYGLSTLASNSYNLGVVGIGRSRRSQNFEEGQNIAERWQYLLEHANEVDLICFADRVLFNSDIFNPFFIKTIRERMNLQKGKALQLRIILSSTDNTYNQALNEWSGNQRYMDTRIDDARSILKSLCGNSLSPDIIREHKSFVPFTLLRGDDYMYVMYFIPGHDGGPVLEIRPPESIVYPRAKTDRDTDGEKLFRVYKFYFEDMWRKCGQQQA